MRDARGCSVSGPLVLRDAALFTDLYELTMAASSVREGVDDEATFGLFVRTLPPRCGFPVAAGLEDVLEFLADVRVSAYAIRYLDSLGTLLIEVTAPIAQAQPIETAVMNICHLQTILASKAARSVLAARGRAVVDFGVRRTHGVDAGLKAARAAWIAGAAATSDVLAAATYDVPPAGTMAHSYVTAFPAEIDSFRAFARAFPRHATLLIDTYDTVAGARTAVIVAREMAARGDRLRGVRLDSGGLGALAREVRGILDEAGFPDVQIFASGGLDDDEVDALLSGGAPIDAFGIGTKMNVSADAPYLDMAYRLVRYAGRDVLKLSPGKRTRPGEKQVYRVRGPDGEGEHDVLALAAEPPPAAGGEPLLVTVMEAGRVLAPHPPLAAVRDRCAREIGSLPDAVRRLRELAPFVVRPSERLAERARALGANLEDVEIGAYQREGVARWPPMAPAT